MKHSTAGSDPFIVIRATVEAELAAPGVLTISSAAAGDGKTAVAAGIARSLSFAGYRVLVIDAGAPANEGDQKARNALSPETAPDALKLAIRSTESGCSLLSLNALNRDVSSAVSIAALYAATREQFDYAIVDASVLNGIGLALARGADGVVLAVREGRAIVAADRESVELLNRLNVRFLGVVATSDRHHGDVPAGSDLSVRLKRRVDAPAIVQLVPPKAEAGLVTSFLNSVRATFASIFAAGREPQTIPVQTSTPE